MRYALLFLMLIACVPEKGANTEAKSNQTYTDYLLYISSRGDGFDIYKFNTREGESRITKNPGWDWFPQPLNDGSFVYYSMDTSDVFSIRRLSIDGEERVFDALGKEDIAVSPDGSNVIYYNTFEGARYMGLLKLGEQADSIAITPKGVYSGRAKWSPDGTKVAYISDRTGTNQLFMYDVVRNKSMQLTDSAGTKKYISWAPDNKRIAFTIQTEEEPADIYVFGLDYGTTDQLTNTPQLNESEIAWSPDGALIAYHASVDSTDHIYTLDTRVGTVEKVTQFAGYHGEPVWIRVYSESEL